MTRQGNVSILIKVRDGTKAALASANASITKFTASVRNTFAAASKYIAGAGIAGMLLGLRKIAQEATDGQYEQAQLAAAIKSTGGVAGQSVAGLNAHAAALQRVTTFSGGALAEAQALLLTFTQVQGETFPRATAAVLDVATAMKTDLSSAALQVGKALNDPVLGVTALARSGIQFTESQKAVIDSLVATGRQAEAQALILDELDRQFGGSARAARDTLGGALTALGHAWDDLFDVTRENSSGMIGAIEGVTSTLPKVRDFVNAFVGGFQLMAVDTGIMWESLVARAKLAYIELKTDLGHFLVAISKGRVGASLIGDVDGERAKLRTLMAELEHYRKEAYAEITGTGATRGGPGRSAPPSGAGSGNGGDGGSGTSLADMLKREQQIDAARGKRAGAAGDGFTETIGLTNAVNRGAGMEGLVGLGLPSAEALNASIAQTMQGLKQIEIVGPSAMEKFGAAAHLALTPIETLEEALTQVGTQGLADLTGGFAAAFENISEGWASVGEAMGNAVKSAVSEMAAAMSRYYALQAAGALAEAIANPLLAGVKLAAAGKFLAAAAGFAALSGLTRGGGGGAGGGGSTRGGGRGGIGGPLDDRRASPVTVIMPNSGIINVNDTRTQDEFRAMLEKLSGRAVEIRRR